MLLLEDLYKELLFEAVSQNKLIKALNTKRKIKILYDSPEPEGKGFRVIQIVAIGTTIAGNFGFRAYQFWGQSATKTANKLPFNNIPSYRIFLVSKVLSFDNTIQYANEPLPNYRPNDKLFSHIIAQL